jgi:hypothetical protein
MRLTWLCAEMPAHKSLQVVAGADKRNWFCIEFSLDKHAEASRHDGTSLSALPYSRAS